MNILWTGDSWTEGIDCENKEQNRFSAVCCRHWNILEHNIGKMGFGVSQILDNAYEHIKKSNEIYTHYVMVCPTFRRVQIPYKNKLERFAPKKNNLQDYKYTILQKLIYTSSTRFDVWFQFHKTKMQLFHDFLLSQNITPYYLAYSTETKEILEKQFTTWNKINMISIHDTIHNNGHPDKSQHNSIAKTIIERIDNE